MAFKIPQKGFRDHSIGHYAVDSHHLPFSPVLPNWRRREPDYDYFYYPKLFYLLIWINEAKKIVKKNLRIMEIRFLGMKFEVKLHVTMPL